MFNILLTPQNFRALPSSPNLPFKILNLSKSICTNAVKLNQTFQCHNIYKKCNKLSQIIRNIVHNLQKFVCLRGTVYKVIVSLRKTKILNFFSLHIRQMSLVISSFGTGESILIYYTSSLLYVKLYNEKKVFILESVRDVKK